MIPWLFLRRHWPLCSLFALALTMLAWSALAPLHVASHERLLEVAAEFNAAYPFEQTFMVSALNGSGTQDLLKYLQPHQTFQL